MRMKRKANVGFKRKSSIRNESSQAFLNGRSNFHHASYGRSLLRYIVQQMSFYCHLSINWCFGFMVGGTLTLPSNDYTQWPEGNLLNAENGFFKRGIERRPYMLQVMMLRSSRTTFSKNVYFPLVIN